MADNGTDQDNTVEGTREQSIAELRMLRALRDVALQAHRERTRYFAITLTVVSGIFMFRQFIPPVWMLWLP